VPQASRNLGVEGKTTLLRLLRHMHGVPWHTDFGTDDIAPLADGAVQPSADGVDPCAPAAIVPTVVADSDDDCVLVPAAAAGCGAGSTGGDPLSAEDLRLFATAASGTGAMKRMAASTAALGVPPASGACGIKRLAAALVETPASGMASASVVVTPTKKPTTTTVPATTPTPPKISDLDIQGLGRMRVSLGAGRTELCYPEKATNTRRFIGSLDHSHTPRHGECMIEFVRCIRSMQPLCHDTAREVFKSLLQKLRDRR
jgi:hypothetical protein